MEKAHKVHKINKDNYRELGFLGEGVYGKVLLVEDTKTENKFALKIIPCREEEMLNYYNAEYETLKDISSKYIIKLIDHMITEAEFSKNPLNDK